MRALLAGLVLAMATATPAQAGDSGLDRAYDEMLAAQTGLQKAEAPRKLGVEPQPGERIGTVGAGSRLSGEYWKLQKRLEDDIERASMKRSRAGTPFAEKEGNRNAGAGRDDDHGGHHLLDEKERVVGIVSEVDLVRRRELGTETEGSWWLLALAQGAARDYRKPHGTVVRDVMTRPVIGVRPSAPLKQLARG